MIPGVTESAIRIANLSEWQDWLRHYAESESALWLVILKKSTGRQTVTFDELLEEALCWGWVDVKTKTVDDEWYGIRFVQRRPKSNWTARNREIACKLIAEGRMQKPGIDNLPTDLACP